MNYKHQKNFEENKLFELEVIKFLKKNKFKVLLPLKIKMGKCC